MRKNKEYRVNLKNKGFDGLAGEIYAIEDNRTRARKPLNQLSIFNKKDYGLIIRDNAVLDQVKDKYIENVPIDEIYVNTELFQNRKKAFSNESTNKIIKAYQEGNFDIKVFDPILLWRNPADFKLYILSGHSRTEAFKQLSRIDARFSTIPAKILDIDKDKAIEIALNSNTLSTKESDIERASYYHYRIFNRGENARQIENLIRDQEGKNANYIIKLSYLNPDGRFVSGLIALDSGDVTSREILKSVSAWVGEARRRYPFLTNMHESELYEFMINKNGYGTKAGQINSEAAFLEKINYLIMRENVMTDNRIPLNPQSLTSKSPFMSEYEARLKEAEKLLNDARKERESKYTYYAQNNVDPARRRELMNQYDALVEKYANNVVRIKNQYNQVLDAEKRQLTLFGLGKPSITAKFEFDTNEDAYNWLHEEDLRDDIKKLATESRTNFSMNGLGAEEIISTNPKNFDFKGYKPTYEILSDYSHLIDKADGKTEIKTYGDVDKTLPLIDLMIRTNYKQVEKLAKHLKANSLEETCFNIWHWSITNIPFKNDTLGHEELRSPARSYADRKRGIDCDCFTILTCSILLNLGIKPEAYVVGFNGSTKFQHIYTVVNRKYIIDPVMKEYGIHPKNITKTYIMPLSIEFLSGIPSGIEQNPSNISFLTGKERLRLIPLLGLADGQKQTGELIFNDHLKGTLAGEYIARLEALDNFKLTGFEGKKFTSEMHGLGEAMINYEFANQVLGIQGLSGELGSLFSKIASAAKTVVNKTIVQPTKFIAEKTVTQPAQFIAEKSGSKVLQKVVDKTIVNPTNFVTTNLVEKPVNLITDKSIQLTEKAVELTKKIAQKSVDLIKKASNFPIRVALLAILKLNIFKLASRLYPAYLTEAEAAEYGIDKEELQKLIDTKNKFEKSFIQAGGGAQALKNAIVNGRGAKIWRKNNPLPEETQKELQGLGEVFTAAGTVASVAASSKFWAPLIGWLKKINFGKLLKNVDVKKLAGQAKDAKEFLNSIKQQPTDPNAGEVDQANNEVKNDPNYQETENLDIENADPNYTENSNIQYSSANPNINSVAPTGSSMLPLILGAGALAAIFLLKKK